MSGTKGISPLLVDPTQVESKKTSQIQWPDPSINAELVDVSLEKKNQKLWLVKLNSLLKPHQMAIQTPIQSSQIILVRKQSLSSLSTVYLAHS